MANLHKRVVAIVGSRDFPRLDLVERYVQELEASHNDGHVFDVVSGGARGVDRTAEFAAHALGLPVTSYRPVETDRGLFVIHKWYNGEDQGMTGGHVFSRFATAAVYRNGLIVRVCSELVAFWDEVSTGTKNSIDQARAAGRRVRIITP